MDLEHQGALNHSSHCEATTCHQRDFLPFTCDLCTKQYCLAHKGYLAHACTGGGLDHKDKYSVACPVCLKSVIFFKSESADVAWEQHYITECSHKQPENASGGVQRCAACASKLGVSNAFTCPTCKVIVCLSCRGPELHKCVGGVARAAKDHRQAFLDRVQRQQPQGKERKTAGASSTLTVAGASTGHFGATSVRADRSSKRTFDGASSGHQDHSSSSSSKGHSGTTATSPEWHRCPQCSARFDCAVALVGHFETAHPDGPSQNVSTRITNRTASNNSSNSGCKPEALPPPLPPAPRGSGGQEVCPYCSQHFDDVFNLISHVDSTHVI